MEFFSKGGIGSCYYLLMISSVPGGYSGLSPSIASRLLVREGFNELPSQKKLGGLSVLFRVLSEPMLLLLVICVVIYYLMGESGDASILISFVLVVVGITYYQERKTEKTLSALRDLSSPRALVIRGGRELRIPGREVVPGDIVVIREGDRIPADAANLRSENLVMDESLLTGESVPVKKSVWDRVQKFVRPGGDGLPFVYSGSMVVSGRAVAEVLTTGIHTQIGKIGKSLNNIKDEDTLLRRETKKAVWIMALIGALVCGLVIFFYYYFRGNLFAGLLAGLTLSMSLLPEEFPVVLMIFFTLGAWRLSQKKVLTRRSAAIESLGAATVLCVDKTGTLTENRTALTEIWAKNTTHRFAGSPSFTPPSAFADLLKFASLACPPDPYDPIDKELNRFAAPGPAFSLVKSYPLSKQLLSLAQVWQHPGQKNYLLAAKGSPEAIITLCRLNQSAKNRILKQVESMSNRGLRVLGVAAGTESSGRLPARQTSLRFKFQGLLGFVDPIRPSVPDSIREARAAGIRVVMITGDYPGTAQYVAREIGLTATDHFLTGTDLDELNHLELREKIKNINIFARVVPEQKLLIVNALKANGEVVAMTGDGVNDAPALKSAHIGIAMGQRGTDVAREAAHLVLLDDNFSSIVAAVKMGRLIFDNLRHAMGYILAVHVPIAGMALLPLILDLPVVLMPAHIAFLELIIDPACSTVFESQPEESGIMTRPPRGLRTSIFRFRLVLINLLQGLGILLTTFVVYLHSLQLTGDELTARSFAFSVLVLANLMLIVVNLSWKKYFYQIIFSSSRVLYITIISALIFLLSILYIPFLFTLFRLSPLNFLDFIIIMPAAFLSLAWFEGLKFLKNQGIF